ncbi:FadR/GntR family transcriptional regulator [Asticcacaulis sp. BYS171W]|uniref:FadR/GntR family transcriptional regulator n=1 Tax=Asticcacaulis aquaticus TaxID=2984212 RepID=A0ABT5HVK6_9CAUL|nr:FadR/GntR family transcriptional regulator [Asticcacaulis aquaticus]MDC7684122.1 FadR/GntR family transcriptional regulator [Asticcacaulis aquaticus]
MRQPLFSTSVTQSIVQDLGVGIVTGRFDNAPFPTESALCDHYGAARTVLREAVKMLIAKGLITTRPRQGIRIAPEYDWNLLDPDVLRWLLERKFSLRLLVEFTQIRLDVESGAAALAAQFATEDDKAQIRAAIKRMYAAELGDDDPLHSDIAFHVAVLKASGNRFYLQMRDMISTALHVSIMRTNKLKGVHRASAVDHDRVAQAILSGDADTARREMRRLIQGAFDLIDTLPKHP